MSQVKFVKPTNNLLNFSGLMNPPYSMVWIALTKGLSYLSHFGKLSQWDNCIETMRKYDSDRMTNQMNRTIQQWILVGECIYFLKVEIKNGTGSKLEYVEYRLWYQQPRVYGTPYYVLQRRTDQGSWGDVSIVVEICDEVTNKLITIRSKTSSAIRKPAIITFDMNGSEFSVCKSSSDNTVVNMTKFV